MIFSKNKYNYFTMAALYVKLTPAMAGMKIIYHLFTSLIPTVEIFLTASFIDNAIGAVSGSSGISDAILPLLGILLIKLFQHYASLGYSLVSTKAANKMNLTVQAEIARSKASVKYKYYENQDCVDVIQRATDGFGGNIQDFFDYILSTVSLTARIVGFIVVLGMQLWWVAILFTAAAVPAFVIAYRFGEKQYDVDREMTKVDRRAWYISDILRGRETLEERRLFGYTGVMDREYNRNFKKAAKAREKVARHMWFDTTLAGILVLVSGVLVIALLIPRLVPVDGTAALSVGMFISLVNAILGLSSQMQETIPDHINSLRYKLEYLKDLNEYLSFETDEGSTAAPSANVMPLETIEFKNVSFRYPGCEKYILKNFNISLESGRNYAIVGVNGAGKTTLIKLLTGLYDDYEGEILLNGRELRTYPSSDVKALVSTVYQDFARYPLDIYHNIAIGNITDMDNRQAVGKAAEVMGLSGLLGRLPNGIYTNVTKIEEEGVDLSGGEWQRIALARLLSSTAPLKILDEPTASLDPIAESRLYEQFGDIIRLNGDDSMTLFISHRLGMTKFMDKIIVLSDGALAEFGSHDELMKAGGLYAEMYGSQAQWYADDVTAEGEVAVDEE